MRTLFAFLAVTLLAAAPSAGGAPDARVLITATQLAEIREILDSPLVLRSIAAQNERLGALSAGDIKALDDQWKAEREADDKPLISMTLSNPLSSYLTRMQANSLGLYAAVFVMDQNGLNVGQSAITGDFWQGDEAKFQKTFEVGSDAVFIDEPEWLDDVGIWIAQVNLTVADPTTGVPVGSATFDVSLTEIARRRAAQK